MSLTNKNKANRKYDAKKSLIIKKTAKKFEKTESYIRMCISNYPGTENRDDIRKFYQNEYAKLESILG